MRRAQAGVRTVPGQIALERSSEAAELGRDRPRIGDQSRLGGRVGRVAEMRQTVDRGDEHQRAAAAPLHGGEQRGRDVAGPCQVDGELAGPDVVADGGERVGLRIAGIADHDVRHPDRSLDAHQGVAAGVRIGDLEGFGGLGRDIGQPVPALIAGHDAGAAGREGLDKRRADAASGPGDQHHLSRKARHDRLLRITPSRRGPRPATGTRRGRSRQPTYQS